VTEFGGSIAFPGGGAGTEPIPGGGSVQPVVMEMVAFYGWRQAHSDGTNSIWMRPRDLYFQNADADHSSQGIEAAWLGNPKAPAGSFHAPYTTVLPVSGPPQFGLSAMSTGRWNICGPWYSTTGASVVWAFGHISVDVPNLQLSYRFPVPTDDPTSSAVGIAVPRAEG